jgi:hypothetical protein
MPELRVDSFMQQCCLTAGWRVNRRRRLPPVAIRHANADRALVAMAMPERTEPETETPRRVILIGGRKFGLPQSRALRILVGTLLVAFGFFGFLPVIGFWMIPLGILVLSHDLPRARRFRRRIAVVWSRWRNRQTSD